MNKQEKYNMERNLLKIYPLGQAGFRLEFANTVVYIDPYLSNSVQEQEALDLVRLKPSPLLPANVINADWIIITHEHRDHCDLETLLPISCASTTCYFIGPPNVVTMLEHAGINTKRVLTAESGVSISLDPAWKVYPVPSAHPNVERDPQERCRWLGYVMQIGKQYIYHAGDTAANEETINAVNKFETIDIAFLPVNERNYFLDRRGIIGNMSIRESFKFAEAIGAKAMVPIHWDMFEVNSVFREEIEFLYGKISPAFELLFELDVL